MANCLRWNVSLRKGVVAEALSGNRLLNNDDIQTNIHLLPDTLRDRTNIDIFRVEKLFTEDAWFQLLEIMQKKEERRKRLVLRGV